MAELIYDRKLERLRLRAHNSQSAARYAVLCDLSGVYDSENEDIYLRGATELQTTPGLAEALFEEFSPRSHVKIAPQQMPTKLPNLPLSRLTKSQLRKLTLGDLISAWRALVGSYEGFDPGSGCRKNGPRAKSYADAIYAKLH